MLHGAWLLAITLAAQSPNIATPAPVSIAAPAQVPAAPTVPAPDPPTLSVVTPAAERDRPFVELFQNLIRDTRALPSVESALLAGFGSGAAVVFAGADDEIASWATSSGDSGYAGLGNFLGDGWVQSGGAIATYGIGLMTEDRRVTHIGSDLIRGQALNGLITRGMKIMVGRSRPSGGGHSFPSGHSSAAFTSAAVLHSHFGWKVGVPAYALSGFIGWSRVRDEHHWISDAVVGATIGTIVGRAVAGRHTARSWAIVPAASATSLSVTVARVGR